AGDTAAALRPRGWSDARRPDRRSSDTAGRAGAAEAGCSARSDPVARAAPREDLESTPRSTRCRRYSPEVHTDRGRTRPPGALAVGGRAEPPGPWAPSAVAADRTPVRRPADRTRRGSPRTPPGSHRRAADSRTDIRRTVTTRRSRWAPAGRRRIHRIA